MRSLFVAVAAVTAVALACLPCAAREFRLIDVPDETTLERRLNQAANDGYRFLASAMGRSADGRSRLVALVARDAANEQRPAAFRVLTSGGDLDRHLPASIRALTERSFNVVDVLWRRLPDWWLPEKSYETQVIWILARGPGASRPRYELRSLTSAARMEASLAKQPLAARRLLVGGRRIHALLGGEDVDRVGGAAPYRVLIEARRHQLRRKLTRASKEGYEVVDSVESMVNAPPVILLKQRPTMRPQSYRIVADPVGQRRRGRLAETLRALSKDGFELLPQTLLATDWVAARAADRRDITVRSRYRLLSSRDGDPASLAQAADRDEFEFVALLTAPAETMILMQTRADSPD